MWVSQKAFIVLRYPCLLELVTSFSKIRSSACHGNVLASNLASTRSYIKRLVSHFTRNNASISSLFFIVFLHIYVGFFVVPPLL